MASRRHPDSAHSPTGTPGATTTSASPEPPTTTAKAGTTRKPRAPRAAKGVAATTKAVSTSIEISVEVRRGMIAEAAYLRAERRGFTGGSDQEREDWLSAEVEVDALLKAGHGSAAQ